MAGRPTDYNEEIGAFICAEIAEGKSLRSVINGNDHTPAMSTVFKWLSAHKQFSEQYATARSAQADALFEEVLDIADEKEYTTKMNGEDMQVVFDSVAVARNRLRVDARKWMAGKLRPKKYGEKLELSGDSENPLKVESTLNVSGLSSAALAEILAIKDAANKE